MEKSYAEKGTREYWKRGRENILIRVDFTSHCDVINRLTDLSIGIFKNCNDFPLSSSERAFRWGEHFLLVWRSM